MKKFEKKVDFTDRGSMVQFLRNHERYSTANGWNRSTSYACNLKIHHLGLGDNIVDRLYALIGADGAYNSVNDLIRDFNIRHDYMWQAGFNGRSGGYLVLYAGGKKLSGYKSFCRNCGKANYKSVAETGDVCGRCGKHTRIDYIAPPVQTFAFTGEAVDMDEDFSDWEMESLAERVQLVRDFDRLADKIIAEAVYMAEHCTAEEETVYVPQKRIILKYA